jgi:hypothetical protein
MRRAALLVLLVIGGLLAVFGFAARFEDDRTIDGYGRNGELAFAYNPSGVLEPVNWRAVGAVATVIGGGLLVGILVRPRSR